MNCLKCGVEIPDNQVFCEHCLAGMARDPIKPGVHIHLPKRETVVESGKKPVKKKRTPTPEEQLAFLRLKVLRLRLTAVILAFLVCVVSGLLILKLCEEPAVPAAGRNYTIDTSKNN